MDSSQPSSSSVKLYPRNQASQQQSQRQNKTPLPGLLQTPAGLAILELQGTINVPPKHEHSHGDGDDDEHLNSHQENEADETSGNNALAIGRLEFPDYRPDDPAASDPAWMKRVHMSVGLHQRLTGEVKKLPRPVAVLRRRRRGLQQEGEENEGEDADLEVVDIVKYKLVFSQRPEPVTKVFE